MLSHIIRAQLPVPQPLVLKQHVLVMDFLGLSADQSSSFKHAPAPLLKVRLIFF